MSNLVFVFPIIEEKTEGAAVHDRENHSDTIYPVA